jgi:hypothetical protein
VQYFEQCQAEIMLDIKFFQPNKNVVVQDILNPLVTDEIFKRDLLMFEIAKSLKSSIAWNLAGGYQVEKDGSIQKVLDIHLNTFKACQEVYQIH